MVTLEQEDYDLLRRVSVAQGASMSSILRDYVQTARPAFEHMANLFESLRRAQLEHHDTWEKAVAGAMVQGDALFAQVGNQLPLVFDFFEHLGEAVEGRTTPIQGLSVGDPQLCNTGVRLQHVSTTQVQNEPNKAKRKQDKKS
jgi:hypothetical protein